MNYVSVCSGIEAATVAWHSLGWNPLLFAEISPFPSKVLAHHYPQVPNVGDFTAIPARSDCDLLVGGTPCQAFSIAGLRGGLGDSRGNLALEFLRLADRLRARWLLWENVPGVLSSNGGRDFGSILGALAELGYGFAWRVLDAQFFGVPQRRRRVFLVGYLGDWRPAAAVLSERDSLRRDTPSRRKTRDHVAGDAAVSIGGGIAHTLKAEGCDASEDGTGRGTPIIAAQSVALRGRDGGATAELGGELAHALRASQGGGDKAHVIAFPISADCVSGRSGIATTPSADAEGRVRLRNPSLGIGTPGDASFTLSAAATLGVIAWAENSRGEVRSTGDITGALATGGGKPGQGYPAIAFHATQDPISGSVSPALSAHGLIGVTDQPVREWPADVAPSLLATFGDKQGIDNQHAHSGAGLFVSGAMRPGVTGQSVRDALTCHAAKGGDPTTDNYTVQAMRVRKLTPRECERLQGFPDDYTLIPGASDTPRYHALGNSMAVPVMRWIGQRIDFVDRLLSQQPQE